MYRDPMDMFGEMDEMVTRLFSRMDREFMNGFSEGYGYRVMVREDREGPAMQEMADDVAPSVMK